MPSPPLATSHIAPGRWWAVLPAVAVLFAPESAGPADADPARRFLTHVLDLSSRDLDAIAAGRVVSGTLRVDDGREVATYGVVRVRMTPDFYVEQFADIARLKADEAILQIGAFGQPPDLADVADLTLDDRDIRQLRDCRVGDCGMQLSAAAINRFRQGVDWRRPDAARQANALMRRILVDYVEEYLRLGAGATMEYADRAAPLSLGREFAAILASASGIWQQFPALGRHLIEYPAADPGGTRDLLYWSKEKIGSRGVVSVTHLAIHRTAGQSPAEYAIGSKHLYGTHYYDASLGLTVLLPDRAASRPTTYLVYVNRSRVDVFGGLFGGVARRLVRARAQSTVAQQLGRLQRLLEPAFDARQTR